MKPICTTLSTQKYGILSSPELARVGALTGSPFTGCRLPWTRLSTSWTLALSLPQLTGIVVHKVVITLRTHIFVKLGCERGKWQLGSEWWSPVENMLLWDGLNSSLWKYHCGEERAQEWGGAGTRRVRMRLDKIPENLRHAEDCNGQMHFKRCDSRASCKFAGRKLKFPFWKKAIFKDDYWRWTPSTF